MPRRPAIRDGKAISPVIATIIIVAIAIVMSIAVAYWALGLTGTFTRFEKLEITAMYAARDTSEKYWNITVTLRSTGTATATINMILLNGKPLDAYNSTTSPVKVYDVTTSPPKDITADLLTRGIILEPGAKTTLRIDVPDKFFDSGVSVEVVFVTAAGSNYPKVVVLP